MLSDSVVSLDSHDECEGTASLEEPPVGVPGRSPVMAVRQDEKKEQMNMMPENKYWFFDKYDKCRVCELEE